MKARYTAGLCVLGAVLVAAVWMAVASPTGDLWSQWTDHLRHQGEAVALVEKGPRIYLGSYDEALTAVRPPCPDHLALWGQLGVPYPPLGVLLHLPLAAAERSGLIAPSQSHRAQVALALLAGLAATALALHLARGSRLSAGWALLWFGPLVVGAGACGMYDSFFMLAALLALSGSRANGARSVWIWRAIAGALHVRGLFAFAFGEPLRPARTMPRWVWGIAMLALLPTVAIAAIAATHAGDFPLDNPLHFTARGWLLLLVSVGALGAMRRWGSQRLLVPLLAATLLLLVDRQKAWWHLLPSALVPLGLLGTVAREDDRSGPTALIAMAWSVSVSFLYLASPWPAPVFWLTVR